MPRRKYIQRDFAVVEVMIVFTVTVVHLVSALLGFQRGRKRSRTSKIAIFARSDRLATIRPAVQSLGNSLRLIVLTL
jgi:hypothetical protein